MLMAPRTDHLGRPSFDRLRQLALSAVGHPGGRPWQVSAIEGGARILANGPTMARMSAAGRKTVLLTAGAAMATMRLGIAMSGRRPIVSLLPDQRRPEVLVMLRHGVPGDPTDLERAMAATVRPAARYLPPVADLPAPQGLHLRARAAVEKEGQWLRTVAPDARERLARYDARIANLPKTALLLALGSTHDVPAEQLRAGAALQNLVLTVRLFGGALSLMAWPADLEGRLQHARDVGALAPRTHVLVAISGCHPVDRGAFPTPYS
ncbi:hypothetical protein SAMN05443637_111124 [Pseudonocardia thermophila]|jgi:hypothetical protein|uniref:Nitroreductase family protein n=2 Tax=Pseudonocardia thermophila TaxID=1848 RepID=A0A1M6V0H5_PSETH|nr:hypothetical protein SAMN05443637_111124 [Pseudonocardia thermophila]